MPFICHEKQVDALYSEVLPALITGGPGSRTGAGLPVQCWRG